MEFITTRPPRRAELRLYVDVGSLDHFRPLLALDLYQRRKLLHIRADGNEAKRRQALGRVGQRDDPYDLAMERGDDLPGRAGRHEHSDPANAAFDLWIAGLRHSGCIRQSARPPLAQDCERPQPAVASTCGFGRRHGAEGNRRMTAIRKSPRCRRTSFKFEVLLNRAGFNFFSSAPRARAANRPRAAARSSRCPS